MPKKQAAKSKKPAPKAAPRATVRTVVHKAAIPGGSIAVTTDKPVKPVGVWIMVSPTKRVRIPAGPVAFAMEALAARIDRLTGMAEASERDHRLAGDRMDAINVDVKAALARLDALEAGAKVMDANVASMDKDYMGRIGDIYERIRVEGRRIDGIDKWKEFAGGNLDNLGERLSAIEGAATSARRRPKTDREAAYSWREAVKVANEHGGECRVEVSENMPDGCVYPPRSAPAGVPTIVPSGEPGMVTVTYQPPPVDVAALCRRHGLKQSVAQGIWHNKCDLLDASLLVFDSGNWDGYANGGTTLTERGDRATLPAALAKYCPVKDEKPRLQHDNSSYCTRAPAPTPAMDAALAAHRETMGEQAKVKGEPYGEPERRADATPEQRRGELERRGLKLLGTYYDCYSHDGIHDGPHAWLNGAVVGANRAGTRTRTLAEFCAALDAVGLVAKPATAEERAALCEKWGAEGREDSYQAGLTASQFEAALRQHLPYTREWREKVLVEEGWKLQSGMERIWTRDGKHSWPWVCPEDAVVEKVAKGGTYELLDRPSFLKFIRDNTPAPDRDATPAERREECERRGLRRIVDDDPSNGSCYGFSEYGAPHAWDAGSVYNKELDLTRTRTLAEFRAALDKVGLVKVPLVGDGPWTVEQLNAAGVKCHRPGPNAQFFFHHAMCNGGHVGTLWTADRCRLLHAANDPDANPEWAARVRKALGAPA